MRGMRLAALAFGSVLALSPVAMAQQNQGQGWGGALDTLNRAVNPNAQQDERSREDDQYNRDRQVREERRLEGSSRDDRRGGNGEYRRYSDRDLQDQHERVVDEQRQMQRERRAIEDEMARRGMRR